MLFDNPRSKIALIVITFNEEAHIARLLRNARPVVDEIFVIDSGSTDATVQIAIDAGARVMNNLFVNHAKQFQWALDNVNTDCDWIMRLDADEMLGRKLIEEIKMELPRLGRDVVGIYLKRRQIFMGRWIRYGGRYPLTLLRIWRRGHGRIELRWMDEHAVVWGGKTVTLEHDFYDHNLRDLSFFTEKHNGYATREAVARLNDEFNLFPRDDAVVRGASGHQARFKRFFKERVFYRFPFGVGPLCYFTWRYFIQKGFLDGREGLIYHFLQGFWYRFLVDAKTIELRRAISKLRESKEIRAELKRLTHLKLD